MTELHSSVFLVMISGQIESGTVSKIITVNNKMKQLTHHIIDFYFTFLSEKH